MRKLLLVLFACVAAVACMNDKVVNEDRSAITFGDSFVEIKTRTAVDPSITTASIDAFDVWAFINQPSGLVFSAERVNKTDEGWVYDNTQWWTPNGKYYFYAVAPVDDSNIVVDNKDMNLLGLGNIDFTNVDGSVDLLYTEKIVETGDDVLTTAPEKVSLQFHHMLSKIKFTFTNGFTNKNAHLAVKGVKISDAPANGNINVNTDSWKWDLTPNSTVALQFGAVNGGNAFDVAESKECDDERLTIPADNTRPYTIEFDLELYYGNELAHTSHKVVTLKNQAFVIGKNYNIKAIITPENFDENALKPIEFDIIEVDKWIEGEFNGDIDWDDNQQPTTPVALATPVLSSSVEGKVVTLSWAAVEGAKEYSVQVDDDIAESVTATNYTFEGDYAVEYTFTVKAIAADTTANTDSEAAVVKVTTEAAPATPSEPTYTTVAEFLAAEVNAEVEYTLKGTITSVVNTSYGNFDLTDETGTVYIYGLNSPDGATNKYWATSGAKIGDDIVIKTVRAEFNGKAQGQNAKFVELITPGTIAFWSFDKEALAFTAAGGEQVVNVAAYNVKEAISVSSNNAQFTATYADGAITIVAAANESTESVSGVVTVTCGALKQEISLTQSGVVVGGGTEVVVEKTMASFGWANAAAVKEAKLDENVTVTFAQGKASNAPAYYTSGSAVRLYQNGATMKISAGGKAIKSIVLTFANNHYYIAPDCGEFSAEAETRTWTGDATEILFTTTGTDSSHRAYIAAIKVTYVE